MLTPDEIRALIREEERRPYEGFCGVCFWPNGPCALCGDPPPRILTLWVREDLPICPECWGKATEDMPEIIARKAARQKRIEDDKKC